MTGTDLLLPLCGDVAVHSPTSVVSGTVAAVHARRSPDLKTLTVLDREIYEVAEAARLLGIPVRTLKNWLDGYSVKGVIYRPVLRETPTKSDLLTWGEFVEAGYLTEYRRQQRIPLPEIRDYIRSWRDRLGVPYPLAHRQPYSGPGRHLVEAAVGIEGDRILYRFLDGQLVLTPWTVEFVHKVEFDHDVARRFWPVGTGEAVVIDPLRSFGAPTVGGVRTEVLCELFLAGDSLDEIAEGYDLARSDVEAAVRYESARAKSVVVGSAA